MLENFDFYFNKAIEQAKLALDKKEVPVGCVFVRDGKIISSSHNLTNYLNDPLAHAEIVSIRQVDCSNCDVYLTCEPCIMCYGVLRRLSCRIFFGCFNSVFGCSLLESTSNIYVANQECIDLLRRFYKMENLKAPIEKRKIKK